MGVLPMAHKIALGIEYCGSAHYGWQRQKSSRSIQAAVECALSQVADETIRVFCGGRTDAGVHALQQVVHFETTADRAMHAWVLGANVSLPEDISILWARRVGDDFHARFAALSRRYRYVILNRRSRAGLAHGRVLWEPCRLDEAAMQAAADGLIGTHDFTSYRAAACQAKSPIRTVTNLRVARFGDHIVIDMEADGFLHHMVRNIVGALVKVGHHRADVMWVAEVLACKDRTRAAKTSAADGLYLVTITYPSRYAIPPPPAVHFCDFIAKKDNV